VDCEIPIPVKEWLLAPRAGTNKNGKQKTQIELTENERPLKEVIQCFINQLRKCRMHYNERQWLALMQKIDIRTFVESELLIFTDFSTTCNLRAAMADNCSQNAHAVLCIFVVLHSPRDVTVIKDEREVTVRINECDVWHFFGDTISKGKKNDHVFHNACLEDIVKHYKSKLKKEKNINLNHVKLWTDNCGPQYKCWQNFCKIASFSERLTGVAVTHRYVQKYHFKGVWDAAGKVVKWYMQKLELSTRKGKATRFPNAWACFKKLRHDLGKLFVTRLPWDDLERSNDPKILEKSTFTVTKRFFGYATEDKCTWERLAKEYLHVVHTDRINIPDMPAIKGTIAFHEVAGERDPATSNQSKWKLRVACMPCSCLSCRGQILEPCKYMHVRQEEVHWVGEQAASRGQRTISMASTEFDQKYKEKLTSIFEGNGSVTKMMLQNRLRLLGKPVSGNKSMLAERLLVALVNGEMTSANDLPLAAEYITDEQELDGVVDEEDSDDKDDVDDGEGMSSNKSKGVK
jgi:hypothetical protein